MNFIFDKIDVVRNAARSRLGDKTYHYPANLTAGIVSLIIAIIMLVMIPGQIEISEKDAVSGRDFPNLLMYLMLICAAVLIFKDLYRVMTKQPLEMNSINLYTELKALMIIAILVATYLISSLTDMFVVGSIFCVLAFLLFFNCRKPLYYAITLTIAVTIWVAFRFGLGVNF